MSENDENGTGPRQAQSDDSPLRRRLSQAQTPEEGAWYAEPDSERRKQLLAELTVAEARRYSGPSATQRVARRVAPDGKGPSVAVGRGLVANGRANGGALSATGGAVRRALRWLGEALVAVLCAFGEAIATAIRLLRAALVAGLLALDAAYLAGSKAIGRGVVAGSKAAGAAFVTVLLGLVSRTRALFYWTFRGARAVASRSSTTAERSSDQSAERSRRSTIALNQFLWQHRKATTIVALAVIGVGFGALSLRGDVVSTVQQAERWRGLATRQLHELGADVHRAGEMLGLIEMPRAEQPVETPPGRVEKTGRYRLKVVSRPPGARVTLGGKAIRTPGELRLEKPKRALRVRVSKALYRTVWRRIRPQDFKPEGDLMQYTLHVRLARPTESWRQPVSSSRAVGTGKRPAMCLQPVPCKPSDEPASAAGGTMRPSGKRARRSGTGTRPTFWLEPFPPRPAPGPPSRPADPPAGSR